MAKLPVGYRSPFNKISSVKPSPMKALPWAQIAVAAAPGVIGALGSLFGRKNSKTLENKWRRLEKLLKV